MDEAGDTYDGEWLGGGQTIVIVTTLPFFSIVPAAGSVCRTVPKKPPRIASSWTVKPAASRAVRSILALAADDVGHRDLLGSLRHRVGDGVATVQDRALIGLLRDDLPLGNRVGEGLRWCRHETKSLDGALCGIGAHPVQRRHGEGLAALRQHHIDGAVVRQL